MFENGTIIDCTFYLIFSGSVILHVVMFTLLDVACLSTTGTVDQQRSQGNIRQKSGLYQSSLG